MHFDRQPANDGYADAQMLHAWQAGAQGLTRMADVGVEAFVVRELCVLDLDIGLHR